MFCSSDCENDRPLIWLSMITKDTKFKLIRKLILVTDKLDGLNGLNHNGIKVVIETIQNSEMSSYLTWAGILFCLSQSAMFSGLNLAFFTMSRLRLEVEVANGNPAASKVLALRNDANFLLATVLWGNVGINVLLTLLSNSVMVGLSAFFFSTIVITIGGEILPQAYFSRNALRMASLLAPLLGFYQMLLYFLVKPTALLLDLWLGKEGIQYFRERDLRQLIHKHINAVESEVDVVEGIGALNFLAMDDVPVSQEGEIIAAESIMSLPIEKTKPVFPDTRESQRAFAQRIAQVGRAWIILLDDHNFPMLALDADAYLRAIYTADDRILNPYVFCHQPIVVTDPNTHLGTVISAFKPTKAQSDAPLKNDIIILWSATKRIITGADILGRLLKGIGLHSSLESLKS